jgi:hypothetical protein
METCRIWTKTITTGSITVDGNYDFQVLSILATTGTTTVLGDLFAVSGSDAITLQQGQALNLNTNGASPLSGITITTLGTVSLVGR